MSKLIVRVEKISKIYKHQNADKLSIVEMEGNDWNCIVSLDQYKEGDLVVYCPPDSVIPNDIIEKYNLEFLKKNGRVGTIKLRKYISQGLVLNIPEGKNWKAGKDVAKELSIIKYEPPKPKFQQFRGQRPTKKKMNPLFDKYTDIDNIKNYNKVFKDGDLVVITEKIHGCGIYSSRVILANGQIVKLGYLVNQKIQAEVLGMDKEGNVIPTKIENWYRNGITENWIKITIVNNRGENSSLTFTPNHLFYNPTTKNYEKLKSFREGDFIFYLTKSIKPSYFQEQVMIGKMLGDASLRKNSIEFAQKISHKNYVDYTMNILKNFRPNCSINRISGYGTQMYGFKTICSSYISNLFKNWHKNGRKEVPKIKLSPISLAFWYMDDGSLLHTEKQQDRISIATNGFNEKSINNLLEALQKFDIKGIKYQSKGWRIRINKDNAIKFFALIVPYIPKCMQYKLPKEFKGFVPMLNKVIYNQPHLIKNKIIKMENVKKKQIKFDIETQTHNYIANGVVVHNSNFRAGKLPRYKDSLWGKIKAFLFGKYEFVYGSHNVQLKAFNKKNFYGEDIYGKIAKKYKLAEIIPEDTIIYGEIYGKGIQDLEYGLDDIDVVFFDMKYKGKYVDWEWFVDFCEILHLPTVPILSIESFGKFTIGTYTDGNSKLYPKHLREGCVIKPIKEEYNNRIGRKILKSVSEEYLLRKGGTEYK